MGIVLWLVFGLIAGILAKFLMPGKAPGGIIVAPIDGGPVQIIMKLVKQADGAFTQTPIMRSSFTPLQEGVSREL